MQQVISSNVINEISEVIVGSLRTPLKWDYINSLDSTLKIQVGIASYQKFNIATELACQNLICQPDTTGQG